MNIFMDLEKQHDLKPVKMASILGVSKSYYSMMRNGTRDISKNVALALKSCFGVDLDVSLCQRVHGMKTEETVHVSKIG